jgi:hypothetical protein
LCRKRRFETKIRKKKKVKVGSSANLLLLKVEEEAIWWILRGLAPSPK